ncbi:MAG: hypothetical protein KAT28_02985 [Candidatus Aenigmarchaeota archaeon]|nr:hypothetical protein [Candidatus Aenigmarchaeota archaeon]
MVTRDEIVELVTGEYPNMEVSYGEGIGQTIVKNEKVKIRVSPIVPFKKLFKDARGFFIGKRYSDDFEVKKLEVYGLGDLTVYDEMPHFREFRDKKLGEVDLALDSYSPHGIYKNVPVRDGNFDEEELLKVIGSVNNTEILFSTVYRDNKEQVLKGYEDSTVQFDEL